jgi:hypothetical protein
MTDLFNGYGIEVDILKKDNFLKIVETLTRIGFCSEKENKLFQTAHILHKTDPSTGKSHYRILHYKELFMLDGNSSTLSLEDIGCRNKIVFLLEEWGLINILIDRDDVTPIANLNLIRIISHADKRNWILEPKYIMSGSSSSINYNSKQYSGEGTYDD